MLAQQLILLSATFAVTFGVASINSFEAQVDLPGRNASITIYPNYIQLWANVTSCVLADCKCLVRSNGTGTADFPMVFIRPDQWSIEVKPLQPDTMYSFTLQCEGAAKTETRFIRTDYDRPSPPRNITANLSGEYVRICWSSPLAPAGAIDTYRINTDTGQTIARLPNNQFFYDTTDEYIYGETKVFYVSACKTNLQQVSICSNATSGEVTFFSPATTAAQTTTPGSSAPNILSHSSLVLFAVVSCLLAMPMRHFN